MMERGERKMFHEKDNKMRESSYLYCPLDNGQPVSRLQWSLARLRIVASLPRMIYDYMFSSPTFEDRPRNLKAHGELLKLNVYAAILTSIGGILLFELSTPQLTQAMNRTAIFPLYFPHAIGLAIASKYQGSVLVGNFIGFYFTRCYLLVRGPFGLTLNRGLFIIMIAALGVLETHIGAWLMQVYLCRGEGVQKKVPTIDNVRQAFCYIVIVLSTTLWCDTLIVVVACVTEIVKWNSFLRFWGTWWLGVVAGMLTISPAIVHLLTFSRPKPLFRRPNFCNLFKSIVLWTILLGLLILVFFFSVQSFVRPLPYLLFPLIIFASFRFNQVGWAIVVAVISLFCAWGTLHRNSSLYYMAGAPKDKSSPSLILQIELFVSVIGLVGIVLAAAVKEKNQLTRDLNKVNEDLENAIALRTNELVKANNELRLSQQRAEQASHAKSDFLANMSHEIRTPIHGILGLTVLLLESELTADQKESLLSLKECADLLLHIINSVLDLAKIEAGRLEVETVPFSIRKMVSSTLRMMQARARAHGLQLLWDIGGAVPDMVVGDPGKLQQCLLNLVGNALKFTNKGSVTVRVTLSRRKDPERPQRLEAPAKDLNEEEMKDGVSPLFARPPKAASTLAKLRSWASWPGPYFKSESSKNPSCTIDVHEPTEEDGYRNLGSTKVAPLTEMEILSEPPSPELVYVEFEVQDTGIGISKEKLADMFDPFTQADASTSRLYGGTGLGLCIVQRFVELLGGTIWAKSELNKGSTFCFNLPFRQTSEKSGSYKPEFIRGPLRLSSLDSPVSLKRSTPDKGLNNRRAHSLSALMKGMKFTLPSLPEGNDGDENTAIRNSSTSSLPTISSLEKPASTKGSTVMVKEDHLGEYANAENELVLLEGDKALRPGGLVLANQDTTPNSTGRDGDHRVTERISQTGEKQQSKKTQEVSVSADPIDKAHRIQNSYTGNTRPRSEEDHTELPKAQRPAALKQDSSPQSSKSIKYPNASDHEKGKKSSSGVMNDDAKDVPVVDTRQPSRLSGSPLSLDVEPDRITPEVKKNVTSRESSSSSGAEVTGASGRTAPLENGEQSQQTLRILLAEDNPINQKVASRQLIRHGHKVIIVGDGKQALETVQENHDTFDLVLMDVQMPNMDGLQATEKIRNLEAQENWSRLPILGLTAHAIQGYQETCLSHGMDGYLGKPFEIKQLLKQMKELLGENRGLKGHS